MKKTIRKAVCVLMAAAVLLGGIQLPVSAADTGNGVTVTTEAEFMAALEGQQSPIIVDGTNNNNITIGDKQDTDKRMLPVEIPANTVIRGENGGSISCRSPIQLTGGDVRFENIKLTFTSSNALGAVPHREIFLAGHTLTMDNVDTYQAGGSSGDLGDLVGTEAELLPTVYAGGYSNTTIGTHASLTVQNSNDNTMFQAIYMGHDAGSDNKVPYTADAALNLDAKAVVRDAVDTSRNSQAAINITGTKKQPAKATAFYGNDNTTLTVSGVSVGEAGDTTGREATVENVGHIVLKDGACLAPKTKSLRNVTLQNGACLDFDNVINAEVTGNFTGESDPAKCGILVLNENGALNIGGNVTGTTQFQTSSQQETGNLIADKAYIFAPKGNSSEDSFVLDQTKISRGYALKYDAGTWSVDASGVGKLVEVSSIKVLFAPLKADLRTIKEIDDTTIPDETAYFEIEWYDGSGTKYSDEDVYDYDFYGKESVVCIRTDYWESNEADIQNKTDWEQPVSLLHLKDHPGKYYLQAGSDAKPGDYTFLFCADPFDEEALNTVADVKALKGTVKTEARVIFYDHDHQYNQGEVTQEPTCTTSGSKTKTCGVCGDKLIETIPASGHKEVTDPAVDPTETTEGKTEGSHCSVCGEVLVAQETIPATGKPETPPAVDPVPPTVTPPVLPPTQPPEEHEHEYKTAVTKEPTCTEAGIMAYACSCGTTYTEEIAPLGHQYKEERTPATVKKAGSVKKVCGACSQAGEAEVIDRIGKIAWSGLEVAYDGREKTPSVSVKDSKGMRLKEGEDYQVRYSKGRTNPGVYKAILEFCGDYSGTAAAKMTIRPKAVSLKKVTGKSKSLLVTWKPQNAQIDGYQIRYSTSGKGGNITKTISAGENAEAKTISALKGKAKYYVRIRTYKTVKADGESQNLYSDWSAKKAARTKK